MMDRTPQMAQPIPQPVQTVQQVPTVPTAVQPTQPAAQSTQPTSLEILESVRKHLAAQPWILSADFHPADDGPGWMLRLCNREGFACRVRTFTKDNFRSPDTSAIQRSGARGDENSPFRPLSFFIKAFLYTLQLDNTEVGGLSPRRQRVMLAHLLELERERECEREAARIQQAPSVPSALLTTVDDRCERND